MCSITRTRPLALAVTALATALVLAGCAPAGGTDPAMTDHSNHGNHGTSTSATDGERPYNMVDEMFVVMMIPHHQQAVEMSDLVIGKPGVDPRVVAIAEQIKAAQDPEIQTMKGWLEEWGVPYDENTNQGMGGMDHGDGMLSDDEMAALEAADGPEATRLYLEGMIAHHEGAVDMAQPVIDGGQHPDVRALAQEVIDTQTAEIATMNEILATL